MVFINSSSRNVLDWEEVLLFQGKVGRPGSGLDEWGKMLLGDGRSESEAIGRQSAVADSDRQVSGGAKNAARSIVSHRDLPKQIVILHGWIA